MKILRHPLFMRPNPESDLEQALDRELRQLPDLEAPATLMPRVLNAIGERERLPWWRKSYAAWPFPARLLFVMSTCGLAVLFWYFSWGLSAGATFGALADEIRVWSATWETTRSILTALGEAALVMMRSAGSWLVWAVAGIFGACYLTTLALGTVCYRLASQRI